MPQKHVAPEALLGAYGGLWSVDAAKLDGTEHSNSSPGGLDAALSNVVAFRRCSGGGSDGPPGNRTLFDERVACLGLRPVVAWALGTSFSLGLRCGRGNVSDRDWREAFDMLERLR